MAEELELDFENGENPIEGNYDDENIITLAWNEHIRRRPGMYIGKLGDGTNPDDGIYVLLKEVLDNSIDEFMMGNGKQIVVDIAEGRVSVRDYGRGIPLGKVVDVSSKMNTGAKYDSEAFKKSVGLNGVGIKAVNALSSEFVIESYRDGQMKRVEYSRGDIVNEHDITDTDQPNGTFVSFVPDSEPTLFEGYAYDDDTVETMMKNYSFLNTGLTMTYNGKRFFSRNGLVDLLKENLSAEPLYPIIQLKGTDIEVAITHTDQYGEENYSFVNGQHTTQGGTHLTAFREALCRTLKDYYGKSNFEYSDFRGGIVAAVSIKVQEPVFESQTKTKLGSRDMGPEGPTVNKFISDFMKKELDNYLHKNLDVADVILKKVQSNERDRRAMASVTKQVRERNKKASLNNKKLLDCRIHLNDSRGDEGKKNATSIFITEGDSAAGSITKIRDVETQAVFSLLGKPLNSYDELPQKVFANAELALLKAALNIDDGVDGLRYNRVIIATDADVDGMHIRLLLLTFFLLYFPDLVKKGHVFVLQTPLFRVRNKKSSRKVGGKPKAKKAGAPEDVYYCYNDDERVKAIDLLGDNAEITRFKGLGEISPEEFRGFIGPDIRLDRVRLRKEDVVGELLKFFMGKNTPDRQKFIIDNLVIEDDTKIAEHSRISTDD
ncbi:MAG: ATP-binding protein [Muribaculaceae bacterium]|nr:ATP-binding protein [Muribaculaceae bacterium]